MIRNRLRPQVSPQADSSENGLDGAVDGGGESLSTVMGEGLAVSRMLNYSFYYGKSNGLFDDEGAEGCGDFPGQGALQISSPHHEYDRINIDA